MDGRNKQLRTEACFILSNMLVEPPEEKDNTMIYQVMPIINKRLLDDCYDVTFKISIDLTKLGQA